MPPIDVLRTAEGERMQAALRAVIASADGPAALLKLLLERGAAAPATSAVRAAVFGALMAAGNEFSVDVLFALAAQMTHTESDLDIYSAARALPLGALMRWCDGSTSAEQREAMSECGLACVSDLVRYCSEGNDAVACDGDLEEQLSCLVLETAGLMKPAAIRVLVVQAKTLCAETAALRGSVAADSALPSLPPAPEPPPDDDLDGIDDDTDTVPDKPGMHSVGC